MLNNEFAKCTHGQQKRDFLFVEDVASGFTSILENPITGIVNIGSGKDITIKDFIETIGQKTGRRDLIRLGALPTQKNEPAILVADTKKITETVGWTPRFDINTGLDLTIEWWKNKLQNQSGLI